MSSTQLAEDIFMEIDFNENQSFLLSFINCNDEIIFLFCEFVKPNKNNLTTIFFFRWEFIFSVKCETPNPFRKS